MSDNKITCKAGSVVATFAAPGDQERARWAALTATEAFAFRMGIPATATLCDEADIYHGGVSDIKIATDAGAVDVQQVLGWIEEATLIPPTASGTVALAKDAHATITALVAEIARLTAELAAARAEVNCGQDGPCVKAPGCARHWQERNRELADDLAAARAVPADVEAALCDSSCWICDREDPIRGANLDRVKAAIARAISDATAARGTVGGLLAAGEERESRAWSEKGKAPPGSCPFCASRISMVQRDGYFIARCSHRGCGAVGPRMRSVSRAADLFCQPPRREAQGMSCGPIVASPPRPRCSCTHEAGDSRCNVHPTCSECGASTTRPVDGCEACRGPLPKGG